MQNTNSLELRKSIGAKLKKARIENGLSQSELGKLLNITHAAIGSYERGRLNISTPLLLKLSEILGRPLTYFLEEDKELKEKYEEELTKKQKEYDLEDNLEFSMEMSIRNYLRSQGLSKESINEVIVEIIEGIKAKLS